MPAALVPDQLKSGVTRACRPSLFPGRWRKAKAWQLLHLSLYDLSVHDQFIRGGQKPRSEHRNATAEQYAFETAARVLPMYEKALGRIV